MSTRIAKIRSPEHQLLVQQLQAMEDELGGRSNLILGLMGSENPKALKLAAELQKEKNQKLSVLDVCNNLGLNLSEAFSSFTKGKLMEASVKSFLALVEGLPSVVQSSVDAALTTDGFKDRDWETLNTSFH